MAQPIDPKSPDSKPGNRSGASAQQVYQQAVSAFKAQSYDQALALFQRLGQLPPGSPYYLKAVMGQVRVHQRLKQVDQARLGCQVLSASSSSEAQQWAQQVLSQLPDSGKVEAPSVPQQTAPSKANLSGFVPLEATASQTPPPSPRKSAFPKTTAPRPEQEKLDQPRPENLNLSAAEAREPESTYQSLFHFQQLNQHPGIDQDDSDRPPDASVDTTIPASTSSAEPVLRAKPTPGQQRRPQALPKYPLGLWLQQGLTAIALLWVTNWAIHFVLRTVDRLLRWVRWPVQLSLPGAHQTYTVWVVGGLVLLALASPWIMNFALAFWHGQKTLSTRQLQGYSPGALRLLRQVCRQRGWPLPELRVIPDQAPLCFSYGWLARNTHIVVSQGILDQGSDEAITALYGYELARMVNGSGSVLSVVGLLLLLLHTAYHRLAQLGDRLTQHLLRNILGVISSIFYGLFWLLRQLVLWLSRLCCSWGDRRAIALTQHPDHLADGLLQLTEAIATDLERWGTLHPLLTSLEVLMPVSSRQAITPGSLLAKVGRDGQDLSTEDNSQGDRFENRATTIATLVAIDSLNPYRQWLRVSASHLPLGERLLDLSQQATRRQQSTAVALPLASPTPNSFSPPLLLLQKGPLAGLLIGGGIAMGLWFLGGIVNRLGWQRLSWLYQDPSVLVGGLWLGLGLGLLLRINALFPDLGSPPPDRQTSTAAPDTIAELLHGSSVLPVQGKPVTLRGQLRGSAGVENWGCQNLYLDDGSGLVKLVNPVPLGSLQGLFQPRCHPWQWIGKAVTVSGWSRYGGGLLWVDIHQVQLDPRHRFQAYGPIWATLLSVAISLIGILTIFRGG
ncbi:MULTISPECIES: M48 family metalloprotease [Cyanophyceae]|uniref:M48 family metalloprotease n=1 Tax=Cyanophyceae TaxID=3028117 RepID=UPI0016883DC7|nr:MULTISPECIES: M48 family metalloprotease [Cyanophyceae]MBD1916029.1 M48 family metalloprotease [Phormidium sp. FACHB-77]MBD2031702.1 M48 family metalloprotease [Phormidium sp. FACHB-322]MBD2052671.1 M48 family metalloprotease [Leptolyngbya sp. FACHB-60]